LVVVDLIESEWVIRSYRNGIWLDPLGAVVALLLGWRRGVLVLRALDIVCGMMLQN
jgi:hypothetical protein